MPEKIPANRLAPACHLSVADMVRDLLTDDPEFAEDLDARLSDRQVVKALAVVRARAGLTQTELAAKMGCGQPKISKLESGVDADLKFGDITAYLQATGHEANMTLVPAGGTLVDDVKLHAFQIKHLLDRMVHLAGVDGVMTQAVASFIEEAARNLARITKTAADALPTLTPEPRRSIQIETPEPERETDYPMGEQLKSSTGRSAAKRRTPKADKLGSEC